MVEQLETPSPIGAPAPSEAADASAEIAGLVEREPFDRVTCRRVHGNYYRCNWWAPASAKGYDNPAMAGPTVTTHHVRKSAFLRVTRGTTGLIIKVV